ncbi:MAG: electron transfer flavoprotein subunit beta/FixA family protein [Candidatus Eisenbacteria bacterium]|nr:electron transfer flavoprotein subunit beta/FixA family protein [Candidatus Eisenbacteria bacterium]
MNVVVLLKQVPDTTDVRIDRETNTLIREGVPSIINPFDMYAIEEGLRLRERAGGGTVTVMSMGPPQVEASLRDAIAMGVDDAVLLSDRAFAGSDTWSTSYTLAAGIRKRGAFDVVLCGKQAIDGDTGQVGPGVAELLDAPQVTHVRKIELGPDGVAEVERLMEDGTDVLRVRPPAVFSVVKEINEPRLPSLKGKMRAKKAEIAVWRAADLEVDARELGLDGSPTRVVRIFAPEARPGGKVLSGTADEVVAELAAELAAVVKGSQRG